MPYFIEFYLRPPSLDYIAYVKKGDTENAKLSYQFMNEFLWILVKADLISTQEHITTLYMYTRLD